MLEEGEGVGCCLNGRMLPKKTRGEKKELGEVTSSALLNGESRNDPGSLLKLDGSMPKNKGDTGSKSSTNLARLLSRHGKRQLKK